MPPLNITTRTKDIIAKAKAKARSLARTKIRANTIMANTIITSQKLLQQLVKHLNQLIQLQDKAQPPHPLPHSIQLQLIQLRDKLQLLCQRLHQVKPHSQARLHNRVKLTRYAIEQGLDD